MQWKWNTWGDDPQATAEDPERLLTLAIAYREEREHGKWAWAVTANNKLTWEGNEEAGGNEESPQQAMRKAEEAAAEALAELRRMKEEKQAARKELDAAIANPSPDAPAK